MRLVGITGAAGAGKDSVANTLCGIRVAPVLCPPDQAPDWLLIRASPNALEPLGTATALADPIKMIARSVYGFSIEQLWGEIQAVKNAPDPRFPRVRPKHRALGAVYPSSSTKLYPGAQQIVRCEVCKLEVARDDRAVDVELGVMGFDVATWQGPCVDYLSSREACQRIGTELGRTLYGETWLELLWRNLLSIKSDVGLVVIPDVRFDNEARAIRERGGEVWRVERPGAGLAGAAGKHESEAGVSDALVDKVIVNDGTQKQLRERAVFAYTNVD